VCSPGQRWWQATHCLWIGQVRPGWPLSQCLFLEGSGEDFITVITWEEQSGSHEMIASALGYSLVIIGNCPHLGVFVCMLGGGLSYKALLFLRGSFRPLL
jgi:hypothetical protein